MEILTIVLSIMASVISGMALFFLQRFFKRKDKKDEKRDAVKAKENMLIMENIKAVGQLTVANAIALRDGKTNGEMHAALAEYERVEKETYQYLLERNAQK